MASFTAELTADQVQSKEWLSSHFGKDVVNVDIVDMSGAGGLNARMNRLDIQFADSSSQSVIMKNIRPAGLTNSKNLGLPRESLFYRELAPSLAITTPSVFFTHENMNTGEKILLLENLCDCIQSGYFFGPHSCLNWGKDLKALTSAAPEGLGDKEIAEKSFIMAAKMHAQYWNDAGLMSRSWLRSTDWYRGNGKDGWAASQQIAIDAWKGCRSAEKVECVKWDDNLVSLMNSSLRKIRWADCQTRIKNTPFTLVHGDFHPGNLMYRPSDDSIILLDWEYCGLGSGPQDLAQFMISHVNRETRKEIETELLVKYYDCLTSVGDTRVDKSEYTFEMCRREYIFGGAERWFWLLAFLLNTQMPPVAKQYFHDIVARFVNDYSDELTTATIGMPRV